MVIDYLVKRLLVKAIESNEVIALVGNVIPADFVIIKVDFFRKLGHLMIILSMGDRNACLKVILMIKVGQLAILLREQDKFRLNCLLGGVCVIVRDQQEDRNE